MDINKIISDLNLPNVYESEEDTYAKEIVKYIEEWLEEETFKQDYIEENLRSE